MPVGTGTANWSKNHRQYVLAKNICTYETYAHQQSSLPAARAVTIGPPNCPLHVTDEFTIPHHSSVVFKTEVEAAAAGQGGEERQLLKAICAAVDRRKTKEFSNKPTASQAFIGHYRASLQGSLCDWSFSCRGGTPIRYITTSCCSSVDEPRSHRAGQSSTSSLFPLSLIILDSDLH